MENYHKMNTFCLFVLTMIAIAFVLASAKVILVPFTLAIFISLIYSPLIHWLQEKFKAPWGVALFFSIVSFIGMFLLSTLFITNSIDTFVQGADQYKESLDMGIAKFLKTSSSFGITISKENMHSLTEQFPIGRFLKGVSTSMLGLLSNTFLVIVFTLFLLTGDSLGSDKNSVFEEIRKSAGKYVQTKILTSGLTAILTYAILSLFKVEMAFMFSMLTFLLNFIPTVGSLIAVLLPLPIIFLQNGFGISLGLIIALLGTVQVCIGNILEPKLMGDSMGLHPVVILLSLTFWGYVWGVTGMFLSIPITATVKIIFANFELTKPIAQLFNGKISI